MSFVLLRPSRLRVRRALHVLAAVLVALAGIAALYFLGFSSSSGSSDDGSEFHQELKRNQGFR